MTGSKLSTAAIVVAPFPTVYLSSLQDHYQAISKVTVNSESVPLPTYLLTSDVVMYTYPLHFFGPGIVIDQAGQALPMRSRKQLALLAYMATEHQFAHSRATLMSLLWPDEDIPTTHNNLRVTLSRLRELGDKLAMDASQRAELLLSDRHTVQLDPSWVDSADVNRFNRLLECTRQHEHGSRARCKHCQTFLRKAVQLYQGDFLVGFGLNDCVAFEEWLFMQRERQRFLVLEAYADLAGYAESTGELSAARGFVQRQIELDPRREPAYRQQMRILARQGERSAALVLFERCRALLSEELGLDPEPETLALHLQILNSEVSSNTSEAHLQAVMIASSTGAAPAAASPHHNLPQQLTPFIGREEEIEQLQAQLANPTYRLLSIVGPGGVGKSRLAQQVAARHLNSFGDGVYFVALAQVPTIDSMPATVAEVLGLVFSASQKSPLEQLIEMIGSKQLLLVLDNFEHLIDGVELLVELLRQSPNVVLLVTSRERLNLQAEDLFELQGLSTPTSSTDANASHFAAVRLFVDRAHRLDKHFKLTAEQLPQVVRICQTVEGLPLAIELAATWIRDLSCQEILLELLAGLDRLETTLHDIDPQHRSLRAVYNSSWRLLSSAERDTLARLAVFRGGFTQDAARSIADASPALLSALRNKSLLRHAGSRRYDMHALVHQFSVEALAADQQVAASIQHSHSQYFLTLLADQTIALDTRNAGSAGARIQPDWENVVVSWQQATAQEEFDLLQNALDGLVRFCDLRGLYSEIEPLLENAVAHIEAPLHLREGRQAANQRMTLHCRLLTAQTYFAECRGLYGRTVELSQKALVLAEALESKAEIIGIYLNQAKAFELIADYTQGMALAEKTLQMAQASGFELQAGICLELIGYNCYRLGDYARATEIYQRLLAFHEQTGRLELPARLAVSILGQMALEQGEYESGLHYCQRFLASSEATDDRVNTAHAHSYLTRVWCSLGHFEHALASAAQSIALASILGDRGVTRAALFGKAMAHRQVGEMTEALACATQVVALEIEHAKQPLLAQALTQLAEVQLELAQTEHEWLEAAANFNQASAIFHANDKLIMAYEAEIGLAELARRRGEIEVALKLIEPILPHLPTIAAEGWDEPMRAYVVTTKVLQAVNDPMAETILDQGLHLLDCLALKITERSLRQNFILAIPAHRELRALRTT